MRQRKLAGPDITHSISHALTHQNDSTPESSHRSNSSWIHNFIYVKLWEEVNASSLVFFRICWGFIMLYESLTYMTHNYAKLNYILNLKIRFKYYGFEWVRLHPSPSPDIIESLSY